MKNVSPQKAQCLTLLLALSVTSAADAKLVFFSRSVPNLISISDRNTIPTPSTPPPATEPITPPSVTSNIVSSMNGALLPGNVSIDALARLSGGLGAELSVETPTLGSDMGNVSGGLVATSPEQAQRFEEGARLALSVSEALLGAITAQKTATNENEATAPFALNDPNHPWSWVNDPAAQKTEPLTPSGVLVADNSNKTKVNAVRWSALDEKTLEFTYALQFTGYGILNKDGHVFASWAITHAIRCSNTLNNSVIDELETLMVSPKSKERDDKIRSLLGYLKNPTLKRINRWLAELGSAILNQQESSGGKRS
jgi:hypothetical protein